LYSFIIKRKVNGQTSGVLLAGILLGKWWGGISLALHVGLGALGLPWFADWTGGATILAGPTGGYLNPSCTISSRNQPISGVSFWGLLFSGNTD